MYVVNPYLNSFNYYDNIPKTTSNNLLLDYPHADRIFVSLANIAYPIFKRKGLEISQVANVYFPYLSEKGIYDVTNFVDERRDEYIEYNRMIDFHHKKYIEHADLHVDEKGITSLYFVLYTKQYFDFPVEIFFKLVR
jgi:adenine-specific DNA methylase